MGPAQTFDAAHLRGIHRHLFQDVYEWAGHLRHEPFTFADGSTASMPTMQKTGGQGFARGPQIDRGLDALFAGLKADNFLAGLSRDAFADKAATAFATINSIHPFREGNGRTQREFFTALAAQAGHPIDFSVISAERMTVVSVAAHERGDLGPMCRMFVEIANPVRVAALDVAQQAIERGGRPDGPHVAPWDHFYMATSEPGQSYRGRFIGAAGENFMMQARDETITIGNTVDLPDPHPRSGQTFTFVASVNRVAETVTNLIDARTEWPRSITETVERRLADHPMLDASANRLADAVRQTFQDPERVAAGLVEDIRRGTLTGDALAHRLRQAPQEFGALRGDRSLLGRDDLARTGALDALPRVIAALQDFSGTHDRLKVSLNADETQFRERMREPVRDLSPEAKAVVLKFHADRSFVPGPADEKGVRELKAFSTGLQERFGATDGRIDLQRLSDAIGDPARAKAFANGMSQTQATVSGIAAAAQGQVIVRAMSQPQGQEQVHASGQAQGPSLSHYPPVR
ncbi:Fic family protein [Rhizobium wenxiniae]|uniref:Fic family protein n=1 Tax=Rhizobium wenxiniae TaxID=1737357 RepID=UPI003C1AADF8